VRPAPQRGESYATQPEHAYGNAAEDVYADPAWTRRQVPVPSRAPAVRPRPTEPGEQDEPYGERRSDRQPIARQQRAQVADYNNTYREVEDADTARAPSYMAKSRVQIRQELPDLGRLYYNPPSVMTISTAKIVTARIVRTIPEDPKHDGDIRKGMRGGAEAISKDMATTCVMAANLYADETVFSIRSRSLPQQLLENERGYAEWQWSICPLRSGTHELELKVSGFVPAMDGHIVAATDFDPIITPIRIRVNPKLAVASKAKVAAAVVAGALVTQTITFGYEPALKLVSSLYQSAFVK
jgi:hypothetical protein